MLIIPSFSQDGPYYSEDVELNGKQYTIEMVWNSRTEYWHLSITHADSGSIRGIKVVPNWPLLKNHRAQIDFQGDLFVLPASVGVSEITYDGLDKDWYLCYMDEEEVQEWEDDINGIG